MPRTKSTIIKKDEFRDIVLESPQSAQHPLINYNSRQNEYQNFTCPI